MINHIEILGHGEIATVLNQALEAGRLTKPGLYIAQGVGNPNPLPEAQYSREKDSLSTISRRTEIPNWQVIYFSTLSITTPIRYARHKRDMENLITSLFPRYVIARLGIMVGVGVNPHTTANFLREKVKRGEAVSLRDTSRDVIEADQFIAQVNNLPPGNGTVAIHGQTLTEREIFNRYALGPLGLTPPYEHEV